MCFSFLPTIESSARAKLRYVTLKLDEFYIEFIVISRCMQLLNGKRTVTAYNIRKICVLASLRLSFEYRKSQQRLVLLNQPHPLHTFLCVLMKFNELFPIRQTLHRTNVERASYCAVPVDRVCSSRWRTALQRSSTRLPRWLPPQVWWLLGYL